MCNGHGRKQVGNAFFLAISTFGPKAYFDSLENLNLFLLENLGIGYVIDHYISYCLKEQKQRAFDIYITDVLRIIAENTAKQVGGSYIKARYDEIMNPPKEDTRSADEIISGIRGKLGG